MGFNEYVYERPVFEQYKEKFDVALENFKQASSVLIQIEAMNEINVVFNNYYTMASLCEIRHCINTEDDFYASEQDYIDEIGPKFTELTSLYYKELLASSFREQLEQQFGKQLFDLADANVRSFSPEIIPDLQLENKLSSEYTKLVASAKIEFDNEIYTVAQMQPLRESTDRNIRKRANEATFGFFEKNKEKFDQIYDDLVRVRTTIAQKLGFENFIKLGYLRMNRTDYNASMVAGYRDQILKYIVPVATKLKQRQKDRLGLDQMYYYDESFNYKTGNAVPQGQSQWIVDQAKVMYEELSPETNEFFNFMISNNLMDLVAKKGKAGGGFCTAIPNYEAPYIFSNFNGTSGDIDVLTHEAGHAFQVYQSLKQKIEVPEYLWPTYEACEIHSMSMEFFTWPWMDRFFKDQTDKYKFTHLSSALLFLPYGVAVDEFQHWVYENYQATKEERNAAWREIEKKYKPHLNYEGNHYLESGNFWKGQGHIFNSPFYYIDYTLAQVLAFQFWKKSMENFEGAWADYLHLCKLGGTKSFLNLVEEAKLISPFAEGSVESIVEVIEEWLDRVEDEKL